MQIFFKNLGGKCYVLEVDANSTIEQVLALVGEITGDKPCDFDLIYAGKWLKGDNTLSDYNITKESTLHMNPKMGAQQQCEPIVFPVEYNEMMEKIKRGDVDIEEMIDYLKKLQCSV